MIPGGSKLWSVHGYQNNASVDQLQYEGPDHTWHNNAVRVVAAVVRLVPSQQLSGCDATEKKGICCNNVIRFFSYRNHIEKIIHFIFSLDKML